MITLTASLSIATTVPKRIKPQYGVVVCNLQFRAYIPQILDFYVDFAQRAAYHLGMPCSGKVMLPTQTTRWTVNKASFVHAKRKENFERKTHKRLLQIKDADLSSVRRWLWYLKMNAPSGVGMRATTFEFDEIGVGNRLLDGAKEMTRLSEDARTVALKEEESLGEKVKAVADKLVTELDREAEGLTTQEKVNGG